MMIDTNTQNLIEENPIALATVDQSDRPNVIAVAFVKVVDQSKLVITNNYMTQTVNNIIQNPNVCLAVWDKKWHGFKLIGKAKYYAKGKWKLFVQNMEENKDESPKGAIVVTVEHIVNLT